MITDEQVNLILNEYDLQCIGGRVSAKSGVDGSVGIEAIYELMFIHNYSREVAMNKIVELLITKKIDHSAKKS